VTSLSSTLLVHSGGEAELAYVAARACGVHVASCCNHATTPRKHTRTTPAMFPRTSYTTTHTPAHSTHRLVQSHTHTHTRARCYLARHQVPAARLLLAGACGVNTAQEYRLAVRYSSTPYTLDAVCAFHKATPLRGAGHHSRSGPHPASAGSGTHAGGRSRAHCTNIRQPSRYDRESTSFR
jgi:hypothetical protein